jgi:hypothetical protein
MVRGERRPRSASTITADPRSWQIVRGTGSVSAGIPHFFQVPISHEAGEAIAWDNPALHSLKRLGLPPGSVAPTPFRPNDVERKTLGLIGFGVADADVRPGRYTVRAVANYFRVVDGVDGRLESEPVAIEVTLEDIRQWRALRDLPGDSEREVKTPPGKVEGNPGKNPLQDADWGPIPPSKRGPGPGRACRRAPGTGAARSTRRGLRQHTIREFCR